MSGAVTAADLKGCELTMVAHMRLSGAHQYTYRCVEHPRMNVTKTSKRGELVKMRYWVDLEECADLDAVAAALNVPPAESETS